ncbi:BACON domain-containing protein [Teredinibacter waterburyi]|uniref:BACON domain-containing protein n=1 Tax=Teredinibacter waterburyi TaxID=1500538 RepID=UPI00165FCAE7|nr:hypothetical protein [Teredinibacter waterburyi]
MTIRVAVIGALISLITACGGGGSTGVTTGGGGGGSGAFTLATSTLNFSADINEWYPPTQTISGSLTNADSDVYLLVTFSRGDMFSDYTYNISGTTGEIDLYPVSAQEIGVGVHTATVTVRACRDANCNSEYSGSAKTVAVTYTVTAPAFSLDKNELNFLIAQGSALPNEQSVTMTSPSAWSTYGYSWDGSSSKWLTIEQTIGSDNAQEITAHYNIIRELPVGEYTSTTGLFFHDYGAAKEVTVNYQVVEPAFRIDDNAVSLVTDNDPDFSVTSQTITVTEGSYGALGWSVSSDVDWLTISQLNGNTTDINSFAIALNSNVENLAWVNYRTYVTLSDDAGQYEPIRILVLYANHVGEEAEPEASCLEDAGVIFLECESTGWNGFTAWEIQPDEANYHYLTGDTSYLINWQLIDLGDDFYNNVMDVEYNYSSNRAMLRVYPVSGISGKMDLTEYRSGTVEFDIRVLNWGQTLNGLEFKLECGWPCESASYPLAINQLNEWTHISFNVSDLEASGLDLENVEIGFQIFPAWEGGDMSGIHFQLDNIRWNK